MSYGGRVRYFKLEFSGTPVTAGEFGAWTPIGAEATSTGYEVACKNGTADQYTVWNTDSSGNFISSPIGAVSGSSASLQSLETSFHQDLNGDGVIGLNSPTSAIGISGAMLLQHQSLV